MASQTCHFGFMLACLLSLSTLSTILAQPVVRVEQGMLMGKTVMFSEHEYINIDRELDVYEGVPYAEAPVRFEHPVKKTAWAGTYDATYARPSCYQAPTQDIVQVSEDCLYMNIYVPRGVTNAAVMVWIHGGGFREGSGSQAIYNGVPLSAVGEVIRVNINYRLATFGFLTTGDDILPGNYGMMDLVEALKWIQTNIHAFGGNRDKVTIFGQSAGSAGVNYLILSKQSRGLFNQAIMESGAAIAPWAFQETSQGRDIAFNMGAALGCTATDATQLRQCLRDATPQELYDAGEASGFLSAICIDNNFLDDHPLNLIQSQDFQRTTLMLGSNADEGTLRILRLFPPYATREDPPFVSEQVFKLVVGGLGNPIIEDSVYQQYLDWTIQDQDNVDFFRPLVDSGTDPWAASNDIVARAHSMAGDQVYLYQMTHDPTVSFYWNPIQNPTWIGACHSEEIQFVFGFPFMQGRPELSGPEKEFSVKIMRFWSEFAKTGSPSVSSDPQNEMYWPTFTVPELNYKVLALDLTTGRALSASSVRFWNDLVPKLETYTEELPEVEREWKDQFYNWKYTAMPDWWDAFNAYKRTTCDTEGCK
ncbi:acetylcholinesterase-like [Amphiura filiformis]|uniref:acetylcholinesterase-like n=1 Tax=Amphiura filiformis TaxID=82378 RepID=UPI003B217FE6